MLVVLASQSKQRRALMDSLGITYQVAPATIDEKAITHPDPYVRAQLVAEQKARAVSTQFPDALIISADTFLLFGAEYLEKPATKKEAKQMLAKVSGKEALTITGLCCLNTKTDELYLHSITTISTFREFTKKQIEYYVKNNTVTEWSGGFSPAYHAGAALIADVSGSLTSFTHGLPMELVIPQLQKIGVM